MNGLVRKICIKLKLPIVFVISCLMLFGAKKGEGQTFDTSHTQFLVNLELLTPVDSILEYLEDLNCKEIWSHEYSGLALWEVNSYPFTLADGTVVLDIHGVIRQSVRKTKINESDYNYFTLLADSTMASGVGSCFNPLDYSIAQGNENNVRISILDTGIKPNLGSASTSTLNYNLTSYTGYDYVNDDTSPEDEHGHGSHIAGLIHSITHAISPNANRINFDIRKTHDAQGRASMERIVHALLDAVDDNADVINMSFGLADTVFLSKFHPLRTAIDYAADQEVLVVTSAGNMGSNNDDLNNTIIPSSLPCTNIISVASLACDSSLSVFSNFGKYTVDVAVNGEIIPGPHLTSGLRYASGTSQAAAIVTASTALLLTTYKDNIWGNNQITDSKCSIILSAEDTSTLSGLLISDGVFDMERAVAKVQGLDRHYQVTSATGAGPGTYLYAANEVCGLDTISFAISTNGLVLPSDEWILLDDLTILGNGVSTTHAAGINHSLFYVPYGVNLHLSNIELSNSANAIPIINNQGQILLYGQVRVE